jgi:hypothetical protein
VLGILLFQALGVEMNQLGEVSGGGHSKRSCEGEAEIKERRAYWKQSIR